MVFNFTQGNTKVNFYLKNIYYNCCNLTYQLKYYANKPGYNVHSYNEIPVKYIERI